jgi:anti-sigma B factor antagonist
MIKELYKVMAIEAETNGTSIIVHISGRLDAITSQQLEKKIKSTQRFISEMVFDFSSLTYISSMGLRVILEAYKLMKDRHGKLTFKNIPEQVRSVFEVSGFLQTIVRDEKAAIIKKPGRNASISYSLIGDMDRNKAAELKRDWETIRKEGITGIALECSELKGISPDAGVVLGDMQQDIQRNNGVFAMQNIPEVIEQKLKEAGLSALLSNAVTAPPVEIEKAEAPLEDTASTKIFFAFKTWEPKEIPLLSKDWLNQHQGIKAVVLNFKALNKMSDEAILTLQNLKKDMAAKGIVVELELP